MLCDSNPIKNAYLNPVCYKGIKESISNELYSKMKT